MSRVYVRCLGGLEIVRAGRPVSGLESQKVRGLLVYLLAHRGRGFTRDHLAPLLWPERDDENARRNLRQALYNLRTTFAAAGTPDLVIADGNELRANEDADWWLDVEDFEESIRRGQPEAGGADLLHLAKAAQLYRGDFLANFSLHESLEFEEWQIAEQERLREEAIRCLTLLVDTYLRRGEFRRGLQYAQRLVRIDPLSEEAHRQVMRLFVQAGQRNRALSQYEELRNLLNEELGVEPTRQSRELYESLLLEAPEDAPTSEEIEPLGPIVPLVGRSEAYGALEQAWHEVIEGRGRLTVVTGEAGIGKTRLVKSMVDAATSRRRATVLWGHAIAAELAAPLQHFADIAYQALTGAVPGFERPRQRLPKPVQEVLGRLVPWLTDPDGVVTSSEDAVPVTTIDQLAKALLGLIDAYRGPDNDPVVMLLEDLQWGDAPTLDLIERLLPSIRERPVWLLAASRPGEVLDRLLRRTEKIGAPVETVPLSRLRSGDLDEIANSLTAGVDAQRLADYLLAASGGLPLHAVELINALWDDGVLVGRSATRWGLTADPTVLSRERQFSIEELVQQRIKHLRTSARRLASLAAVMGRRFEADVLQTAADEHSVVVEVGIEQLLDRWLVRQFSGGWSEGRREPDAVLWARGARRGAFEFNHDLIRQIIYDGINPLRRQIMHRQLAEALEERYGPLSDRLAEELAHHYVRAGEWEPALRYLRISLQKARAFEAWENVRHLLDLERQMLAQLVARAETEEERKQRRQEREAVEADLAEIEARLQQS